MAYQAADLCRMQLFLRHRFLETALYRLPLSENTALDVCGTDGRSYYYQPVGFLKRYLADPKLPEEIFLHMLLHCVFQHPFQTGRDPGYWNLAADIAAAAVMRELECPLSDGEEKVLNGLEQSLDYLSAQTIYRFLFRTDARRQGVAGISFGEAAALFSRDDHRLWASEKSRREKKSDRQKEEESAGKSGDEPGKKITGDNSEEKADGETGKGMEAKTGNGSEDEAEAETGNGSEDEAEAETGNGSEDGAEAETGNGSEDGTEAETGNGSEDGAEAETGNGSGERADGEAENGSAEEIDEETDDGITSNGADRVTEADRMSAKALEELRREWKDVAERMDVELQSFSARQGSGAGNLLQNLREVERDRIRYTDFLRKFAVLRENMELDLDEFDYVFYTYGLNLYGNVPLVEPLEYKEVYRIHDFVIAIDTSGSCSGETVEKFLRKTYSILKESESFDKKVNIHLVQCDCVIQKADVIESLEELESYMAGLKLYGFGGTDFRPVFAYVEEQIQKHAFSRLEGLIYFTDGCGTFPDRPPRYRTAFAFVDQKNIPSVPPWAMRVIWDEEEFREDEH